MKADESGGGGGGRDGGGISRPPRVPVRRSRLAELADTTVPAAGPPAVTTTPTGTAADADTGPDVDTDTDTDTARIRRGQREFGALLGEFRRTPVLLPLGQDDAYPLTADFNGVRWIYAFSDEAALARFAILRGESDRPWNYQRVLGARLLDGVVPTLGVPCGVALDVGSEGHEALFPPVVGIVPDTVAVDIDTDGIDTSGIRTSGIDTDGIGTDGIDRNGETRG
ncbi:hypothetical protein [Streptomyces sp. NPDC127108]|uniref:hypothetical protein n=1 Tax=Streptomyces sp. NPDC127108 TaxID=3345361 RepID=UPI00363C570D